MKLNILKAPLQIIISRLFVHVMYYLFFMMIKKAKLVLLSVCLLLACYYTLLNYLLYVCFDGTPH